MPKHTPSIDPAARIAPIALVDEYHPSLGTRVPPTVNEAGASIGHLTIVYASACILANATVGDRCTLSPHSIVKRGPSSARATEWRRGTERDGTRVTSRQERPCPGAKRPGTRQ